MEETPIDRLETSVKTKRPVLLTVLCILTWLGSVCWIALEIHFFTEIKELSNRLGIGFSFTHFYVISCTVFIVSSLICIVGSMLMWKLRKIGFGLYVTGQLLAIVFGGYLAVRAANLPWMYIIEAIVSMLFIVLYSRCLKVLKS